MTKGDIYTVAGNPGGAAGVSGDGGAATSAYLNGPTAVAVDDGDQLYIADTDNNRVQEAAYSSHTEWGIQMTADDVYTIAGSASGTLGFSGDGGLATSALLSSPDGVTLDGSLNLYVSDSGNQRVREVSASTGDISTYAGDGCTLATEGNYGPSDTAALDVPDGVATDAQGNVYVADSANNRIEEIAASSHTQWGISMTRGDVYTVAGFADGVYGSSGNGVVATDAYLESPEAVAVDSSGNLYIADAATTG
jgi:sugar lactone lactonase YvrE